MRVDRRTRAEVFPTTLPVAASHHVVSAPVPPHVHDFLELALVTGGQGIHQTSDGPRSIGPGDLVVIRPGRWHGYALPEAGAGFEVTNGYLGAELVHGELAWVLDYPGLARLLLLGGRLEVPLEPPRRKRVAGWLGQLAEEQHRDEPRLKSALLACVLVELSRAAADPGIGEASAISRSVRQALLGMTGDLAHPWTVTELAGQVGTSASGLYRQFRTQLGSGPVEWLTRARAERAASLLSQTDLAVAAVGRRVGWPDPSYASRRFRQAYGMSPSAYRAAHGRNISAP